MLTHRLTAALALPLLAAAQGSSTAVENAEKALVERTAPLADPLRTEFRLEGAQALALKYPKLARQLLDPVVEAIHAGRVKNLDYGEMKSLALASPGDAIEALHWLPPDAGSGLMNVFLTSRRYDDAVTVFRMLLAQGQLPLQPASGLLKALAGDDPVKARGLFEQILAVFPEAPEPLAAWAMISCADAVANADPKLAAAAYERILAAASKPGYGAGKASITARFASVETHNTRDTLLLAAGSRLNAIAPMKLDPYREQLGSWDLSQKAVAKSVSFSNAGVRQAPPPEIAAISKRMSGLRDMNDRERARATAEIAGQIDGLLASSQKLSLASGLANLSTEGDLGKDTLAAVATTLAHALHENPGRGMDYLELASLVKYEHAPPPAFEDPGEKAAESLLDLRDQIHQSAGFTLTGLDGKTYTLEGLRGKIVLLNFWATWCPPCRKEMPDLEKLSHAYADRGLVVLAVSDEARETVAPFIEKQGYTFPVLLDPDRKVNDAFDVTGIPKTFLFDREGRLAAQAIDMRTEGQFRELLKAAGMDLGVTH